MLFENRRNATPVALLALGAVAFIGLYAVPGTNVAEDALAALETVEHMLKDYIDDETSTSIVETVMPGDEDVVAETAVR